MPEVLFMEECLINNISYYVTVMPQYGPSLKIAFYLMNKSFRLETICLFAINIVRLSEKQEEGQLQAFLPFRFSIKLSKNSLRQMPRIRTR